MVDISDFMGSNEKLIVFDGDFMVLDGVVVI